MGEPYFVIEGILGSGKTTQTIQLAEFFKEAFPGVTVLPTREPGGDEVADRIREVVLDPKLEGKMDPVTEVYLFAASRAQTLRKVVKPIIASGGIVVCDRNLLTSCVNQGCARSGLTIEDVLDANRLAIGTLHPGLVFYLKLPFEVGWERRHDLHEDKFDAYDREFYEKVIRGYDQLSKMKGLFDKWETIDANRPIEAIAEDIKAKAMIYLEEIGYISKFKNISQLKKKQALK